MKYISFLFLLFCFLPPSTIAQITAEKANEQIIGVWEGTMPLKMATTDTTMKPSKVEAFVNVKFEITFGENEKECIIEPIEIDSIYYTIPNLQEIRQILKSKVLFHDFIKDNNIKILGYRITPELNLNISIDKELSVAGAKLEYLTQDMEDIKILDINEETLELSVPTRSKWDDKTKEYIKKEYVIVKLTKVKRA